jgi:hypothetical protein
MVIHKKSYVVAAKKIHAVKKTISYFNEAFSAFFTISPFDIDNTYFTYWQPMMLIGLISLVSSIGSVYQYWRLLNREILKIISFGFIFNFSKSNNWA